MKRTTISLSDDLSVRVGHEAKRQGISVSAWVRRAIRNAILGGASGERQIPWAGIFEDAHMVRGRDVDGALHETWADDIDRGR